jgi:GNAT superfamily N-acetyltransferase
MKIRNFEQKDLRGVIDLWNRTLWADRIYEDLFFEKFLLDPNFDKNGFFVIEENGILKAAAISFCRTFDQPWGFEGVSIEQKNKGFLIPLLIEETREGIELGQVLLEKAENYLREKGRKLVSVCEYNPLFCVNGVDQKIYPQMHSLFLDNGYNQSHISYSMKVDLDKFRISDETQEFISSLEKENITFNQYSPDDMLKIREFFMQEFPRWITHFMHKVHTKNPAEEMMFVKQGEEVVGYCQYNYYGQQERVGPFGAAASMRGKKIGQAMVSKLLERMTCKGFKSAYFVSCAERVKGFYARNGFKVFKEKSVFEKQI